MKDADIGWMLSRIKRHLGRDAQGMVERVSDDPFDVLVSTVLSLRTKDETTEPAARRLLARAPDPAAMLAVPAPELARLIYPVGFYRRKAEQLREVSRLLLERHGGRVPPDMDALLALPGVGRKTANLVLSAGFGIPAICVDTHVHRITNRWGYVRTRTPDETEQVLRGKLPRRWWLGVNRLLVLFGKSVCQPVSPRCSTCPVAARCVRVGVGRSR
ncbi:MAG: endonuclease III [Deltaproteobacteria bacterium]|nr:endonuclease III [Deltaproteobacteria bacterium]